jgi:hypothetical protein
MGRARRLWFNGRVYCASTPKEETCTSHSRLRAANHGAATFMALGPYAQLSDEVMKIGVIVDIGGVYAGDTEDMERLTHPR